MLVKQTTLYRGLLRELRLSVRNFLMSTSCSQPNWIQIPAPRKVNGEIKAHFRSLVELCRGEACGKAKRDLENAVLFLKSQREHKVVLEKPLPCGYVSDIYFYISAFWKDTILCLI